MHRMLLQLLLLAVLYLHAANAQITVQVPTVEVQLQKNEDQELGSQYFLPKQGTIIIKCIVNSSSKLSDPKVQWGTKVTPKIEATGRFQESSELSADKLTFTSTLTVKRAANEDVLPYICTFNNQSGTGNVLSRPIIDLKVKGIKRLDVSIWPGETITVVCDVINGNGSVTWRTPSKQETVNNGTLTIADVKYETDRGQLECSASNVNGSSNSALLFLRVKSSTSFVIPLIILIVEIIVIGIITAIYEFMQHRRRQQEAKED